MKDLNKFCVPIDTWKKILSSYDIESIDNIEILWDNENLVFRVKDKVLRLTKFTHRTKKEIDIETKLLNVLHKYWADVVKLIISNSWNNFEVCNTDEIYVTVFENARWKIINLNEFENKNEMIREWWRTMWKIHKIISINSDNLVYENRLDWENEIIIKDANKLLDENDIYILEILNLLKNSVANLWKTNENYWLVHTDMRPRNFHYDNWKIIHFDFDDISNNWFIYDIAVAAFHETEMFDNIEDRTKYILNFLKNFIEWYLTEKSLNNNELNKLIDFMHIRLIYAYIDYFKRLKIKWVDSWKDKMLKRKLFIGKMWDFINIDYVNKLIYSFKK